MKDLLPCPFCGGEAEFEVYGGTACAVVCQTCQCGTSTVCLDDGTQAVEAWNRRAERACSNVSGRPGEFECSECGATLYGGDETGFWIDNGDLVYCPSCGAKVTHEKDT